MDKEKDQALEIEETSKEENRAKTYETVINHVKADIISGKLTRGVKLPPEREMAKKYGVSRTSVREALRTLEILGVVESIQGSGNFIAADVEKSMIESMSMMFLLQQVDDLQMNQLREALEMKAVLLAVDQITDEEIDKMEAIVKEMSESEDEKRTSLLDKELHYTLAAASHNVMIVQILAVLSVTLEMHIENRRSEILSDPSNSKHLQEIHENLVSAMRKRDGALAREAMTKHFEIISRYIKHTNTKANSPLK